jgi:hypothetical protein
MYKGSCKCPWILPLLALSLFPAVLFSQEASGEGRVFHVRGTDFSISSENRRFLYDPENPGELPGLVRGDLLQTGAATWVEFQLVPGGTVIKAGEHTSLAYNGYDEQGNFFDIALLYGRIRAVSGEGTLVIRSGTAAVRLEEGDLGMDYFMAPLIQGRSGTAKPRLRLYAFRGGAGVSPFDPAGGSLSAPPLTVKEGEFLSLEVQTPLLLAERGPLEEGILRYWIDHNFEGRGPAAMPETALALETFRTSSPEAEKTGENLADIAAAAAAAAEESGKIPALSLPGGAAYAGARRIKNITLGIGLGLAAAGAGMQGFSYHYDGSGNLARNLHTAGYVPLGVGLVLILAGLLYNPPIQ